MATLKARILGGLAGAACGALLGSMTVGSSVIVIGALVGYFAGRSMAGAGADPAPAAGRPMRRLAVQALGAVPWGVFIVTAPIVEVLILLSPLWIVLLTLRERARARRYGFWPGAVVRLAVVLLIIGAAAGAPVKYLDEEIDAALPGRMTLSEMEQYGHGVPALHDGRRTWPRDDPEIAIPAGRLTVRELLQLIERQAGLKAKVACCGNGATILGGAYPIYITLEP